MPTDADAFSPALERLLTNFAGTLRRVCARYRLAGAEVDELVQEVRIRLWRAHGGSEQGHENLAAIPASYLHRTALSAAIDLMRRSRARRADRMVPLDDEVDALPEDAAVDAELAGSELAERVERAIEQIHPSRRPVVRMHLMGHSRDEIARVLGWTEGKTRNLLYRGLADLREQLLAQGIRWNSPS